MRIKFYRTKHRHWFGGYYMPKEPAFEGQYHIKSIVSPSFWKTVWWMINAYRDSKGRYKERWHGVMKSSGKQWV